MSDNPVDLAFESVLIRKAGINKGFITNNGDILKNNYVIAL